MKKFLALLLVVMLSLGCAGAVAEGAGSSLQELYSAAELLMVQGDYMGAAEKFEALATYSDASQMAMYCKAIAVAEMGMYGTAVEALNKLGDFKDCKQLVQYYAARSYEDAAALASVEAATDSELATSKENYEGAIARFSDLALYKDSLTRLMACKDAITQIATEQEIRYQQALALEQAGDYEGAISIYLALSSYDKAKERIKRYQYVYAGQCSENYIAVRKSNGLSGYIDTNYNSIAECKWKYAMPFSEGLAQVGNAETDLFGYIDTYGNNIIQCVWQHCTPFEDGFAYAKDENQWQKIDKTGSVIGAAPTTIFQVSYHDGLKAFDGNFYDEEMNVVFSGWEEAQDFNDGYAPVKLNDKWGIIDRNGELVIQCEYDSVNSGDGYFTLIKDGILYIVKATDAS